jgi:hypothetical protein
MAKTQKNKVSAHKTHTESGGDSKFVKGWGGQGIQHMGGWLKGGRGRGRGRGGGGGGSPGELK